MTGGYDMQQDTRCAECGRPFDESVVRAAFQEKFKGKFDCGERAEGLCFACACLTAERGYFTAE